MRCRCRRRGAGRTRSRTRAGAGPRGSSVTATTVSRTVPTVAMRMSQVPLRARNSSMTPAPEPMAQPVVVKADVRKDERDRADAQPAMPGHEPVAADHVVDPGDPGHQHDLREGQIGPDQGRDLAETRRQPGRRAQSIESTMDDPHAGHEKPDREEARRDVRGADGPVRGARARATGGSPARVSVAIGGGRRRFSSDRSSAPGVRAPTPRCQPV